MIDDEIRNKALCMLSSEDKKLLSSCIKALDELASGIRQPRTQKQEQFLLVIEGRDRPSSLHERAYLRYLDARQRLSPSHNNANHDYGIPDREDGCPDSRWSRGTGTPGGYEPDDRWD